VVDLRRAPVASERRRDQEEVQEDEVISRTWSSSSIASRTCAERQPERRRLAGAFWVRDGATSMR
jgi:hypothetical protein